VLGLALWWVRGAFPAPHEGGALHRALWLAGVVLAGAASYAVALLAAGIRPRAFFHRA
jgi:hypothetical protein